MVINYKSSDFYDELLSDNGTARDSVKNILSGLENLGLEELKKSQKAAEDILMQAGVTFTVYSDTRSTEKIMPFDIIPRIIQSHEWQQIETGLKQRIHALNLFIADMYGQQKILKANIFPPELIFNSEFYLEMLKGFRPPHDIWVHISGIDIVRGKNGEFYILEDNLRCPSGISYVLENRNVLKRTLPELMNQTPVRAVSNYPSMLFETLKHQAKSDNPTIAILTPGVYNSAYFEHTFLSQQMGTELVEGRDLIVVDKVVYMKTTQGLKRVDVIYRRIDDDFLDPKYFRKDSMLGVAGIMDAYLAGNVVIVNAPGVGISDDKGFYPYVPAIIKYYLGEDAILQNVPTYMCANESDKKYVIENIANLVVKPTNLSGGYGILIGPHATKQEHEETIKKINEKPNNYIAQPVINLSTAPTITESGIEARHLDLRPYILYGKEIFVLPGGLSRVALRKGSLIVNSSQGGGSKDTWVLDGN
jgi:uncharacterized circularly permuted ATP-grasp superfamily protein